MEDNDKLDLVNRIYSCFLQAMEFDPRSSTSVGVGVNHCPHLEAQSESSHPGMKQLSKGSGPMALGHGC